MNQILPFSLPICDESHMGYILKNEIRRFHFSNLTFYDSVTNRPLLGYEKWAWFLILSHLCLLLCVTVGFHESFLHTRLLWIFFIIFQSQLSYTTWNLPRMFLRLSFWNFLRFSSTVSYLSSISFKSFSNFSYIPQISKKLSKTFLILHSIFAQMSPFWNPGKRLNHGVCTTVSEIFLNFFRVCVSACVYLHYVRIADFVHVLYMPKADFWPRVDTLMSAVGFSFSFELVILETS